MADRKSFKTVDTVDELNIVNDAQKQRFRDQVEESNGLLWKQRISAYSGRWAEALVYAQDGSDMLDIGCGWPIEEIWQTIIDKRCINYHIMDLDPKVIASAKTELTARGLPATNAIAGPNTSLDFKDSSFDYVFSSHCLEHSSDLAKTMSEIHRVLRESGTLFFAVPFGFDDSDEHLLYLDIEDWLYVMELSGFDVINYHVGKTYPMSGWDLCIVARRLSVNGRWDTFREFMAGRIKAGKSMATHSDTIFRYEGPVVKTDQYSILEGSNCSFTISAEGVSDILFLRHDWSGMIELSDGTRKKVVDLYNRLPFIVAVDVRDMEGPISGRIIARSRGKAAQAVVYGALIRDESVSDQ